MALPTPSFISRDPQAIIAEMVADYEARVGRTLEPAQAERILIQSLAYRELLVRNQVQEAALQNLLSFSRYPVIDYLGELLGVKRLPAAAAGCDMEFTLVSGHGGVTIPSGTRIGTADGRAIFELVENVAVAAGELIATGTAICQTAGIVGNDYPVGSVTQILDPQAYLTGAENTSETAGGSDEETDDELRERIRLAPNAFSTAGSEKAYEYHARSAHPSIIDVAVVSPVPGTVALYPLVQGGEATPTEVLDAVLAVCSAEKVRPLTDTVVAYSPTKVDYTITVDLELYTGADQTSIVAQVTDNLEAYRDGRKGLLGLDIVNSQLVQRSVVDGVYNAVATIGHTGSPAGGDLIIAPTEFGNCTAITVNVTGFNNG